MRRISLRWHNYVHEGNQVKKWDEYFIKNIQELLFLYGRIHGEITVLASCGLRTAIIVKVAIHVNECTWFPSAIFASEHRWARRSSSGLPSKQIPGNFRRQFRSSSNSTL